MVSLWARNGLIAGWLGAGLAGCASGPVGVAPAVTQPEAAADLHLRRDHAPVGLFFPFRVQLDGQDLYRLGPGQAMSLRLDPGQYLLEYRIGLNECQRVILVHPRETYRYRLSPHCLLDREG